MRLFVAVELPAPVRTAVAEAVADLRSRAGRLRWVDPQRYHLTLVFLGTVDPVVVDAVAAAAAAACAPLSAFELRLDGSVGTFGRRVLWAGLAPSDDLAALAAAVTDALRPVVALPDGERPFSAHLTLARAGRDPVRASVVSGVSLPALSWRVERAVLLRSADGYSVERVFPLLDANA